MAFDDALADRVRHLVRRRKGLSEKRMFGGVGFLLNSQRNDYVIDHAYATQADAQWLSFEQPQSDIGVM
ncbi:MAG: hypothetical protein HQ518_13345 [Rhodopirellula sp.]|nr:hypothetical protein [Rhodopirellula sp.]